MDYLIIEGYKAAAEEFSKETGLSSPVDLRSIESRMNIRDAMQRGDIDEAIDRVNDLNPDVSVKRSLRLLPRTHHRMTTLCTTQ